MDTQTEAIVARTTYLDPDISYIKNATITEWDIHSAGLSVLEHKHLLSQTEIDSLKAMSKEDRVVSIGKKIIRNPELSKAILDGLAEVRKEFAEANGITSRDILSIKKDAIFVINKYPTVSVFGDGVFVFRPKSTYSTYMRLGHQPFEAYYSAASRSVEIKGVSEDARERQKDHIIKDIGRMLGQAEMLEHDRMFKVLVDYRRDYLSKSLDKETYRSLIDGKFSFGRYEADEISDDDLPDLDVSANFNEAILPLIANII